jgi:hypothetical protein
MSQAQAVFRAILCSMPLMLALPATSFAEGDVATDIELKAGLWSRDLRLLKNSGVAAGSATAGVRWTPTAPVSTELEVFAIGSAGGGEARSDLDIRKGFVHLERNRMSLRVGRQVDVWGRADRLNPTDVLSPRDYTTLSADEDDQRRGLGMARLDIETSETGRFSAYWVPEFRANRLLVEPPSTRLSDDHSWEPDQFALKYDATGGAVDWSLSYYQGLDRTHDVAVTDSGPAVKYNTIQSVWRRRRLYCSWFRSARRGRLRRYCIRCRNQSARAAARSVDRCRRGSQLRCEYLRECADQPAPGHG